MMSHQLQKMIKYFALCTAFLFITVMFGCSGDNGTSVGTIAGQVTDNFGNKVAGAKITPTPLPQGSAAVTTDANGNYSITLPNGSYSFAYAQTGYASQTKSISVISGQTTTTNVVLTANAAAAVNVANAKFAAGKATLTANVAVFDPTLKDQAVTFEWKDAAGNVIGTGSSVTVNQPTTAAYKAVLAEEVAPLKSIDPAAVFIDADGEENAHKDTRTFETLDRVMVVGIPQEAFEKAAVTGYTVTATISGKTFAASPSASVATNTLPFVPNPGLRNVPVGQPVMLQGKNTTSWNWTMTAPAGSGAALVDPTTRFPHFIPDVVGNYVATETVSGVALNIYAGKYIGILVPAADKNSLGTIDTACSQNSCHPDSTAFNSAINAKFTEWDQSGHREIMVQGMSDPTGHYSITSCAKCHSVGFAQFSSAVKAGGFEETYRAAGFTFKQGGTKIFDGFDPVLRVSEVQCESCHGPNNSGAHATTDGTNATNVIAAKNDPVTARISYSADVCAPCHGEPLRHGRFQEWRESGHGDFETAVGEGFDTAGALRGSCAGCHTAQGFIQLIQQLQAGDPRRDLNTTSKANLAGMTTDNVQPQTCVTCHVPHNPGQKSGLVGAIVILRGDYQAGGTFDGTTPLLPGGFQANGVGRGALCITCHNSRNGNATASSATATLHEDGDVNWGNKVSTSSSGLAYASPHEACQGDVLMGRNAYFFGTGQIGQRSRHSMLADACVTCHLQKTPADPTFGYPANVSGAGTNHSFGIITDPNKTVNEQINALCAQCHGNFEGVGVQKSFTAANNALLTSLANATLRLKFGSAAAIPGTTTLVFIPGRTPQVSENGAAPVNLSTYLTGAPGTTNSGGTITGTGFNLILAKANWNATLIETDGSEGVHNPSFTFSVIDATRKAVDAL